MTTAIGQDVYPGLQSDGRSIFRRVQFFDVEHRVKMTGDGALREFDGIAVPYGVEVDLDGWNFEKIRGSASSGPFDHQLNAAARVKVANRHMMLGGDLIGRLRSMANDAKGLRVRGKITAGVAKGDEALALLADDALDEMSIGWWDVPGGTVMTRDADHRPHWELVKGNLFEVALEPWGAYGRGATVDTLRAQGNTASGPQGDADRLTVMLGGREVISLRVADLGALVQQRTAAPAPAPVEVEPAPVEPAADLEFPALPGR